MQIKLPGINEVKYWYISKKYTGTIDIYPVSSLVYRTEVVFLIIHLRKQFIKFDEFNNKF